MPDSRPENEPTVSSDAIATLLRHADASRVLSATAADLGLNPRALTESDCDRLLRTVAGRRETTLGHVAWYARTQVPVLFTEVDTPPATVSATVAIADDPIRSRAKWRTTRESLTPPEGRISYVSLVGMFAEGVLLSDASRVVRLASYKVEVQDRMFFTQDEALAIVDAVEAMGDRWHVEARLVRTRLSRRPTPVP